MKNRGFFAKKIVSFALILTLCFENISVVAFADELQDVEEIVEAASEQEAAEEIEAATEEEEQPDNALKDKALIENRLPAMAYVYRCEKTNVYKEPDSESKIVGKLKTGSLVSLESAYEVNSSEKYFYVRVIDDESQYIHGYINAFYVVTADDEINIWGDSVDSALDGADDSDIDVFPDEFKAGLRKLKNEHPSWRFVKYNTELKWKSAVSAEMLGDRSWIEKSADSKYVNLKEPKTGNWYAATEAGVSHYMNPVTYFDSKHVFAFESMAFDASYQTEDNVYSAIKDTFMKGKLPGDDREYSEVLYTLGKKNEVNPIYLAARIIQEQGTRGTSLSLGTSGYYNYFNIKDGHKTELDCAKAKGWDDAYTALKEGIEYISKGYIKVGQNTLYLQKWDFVGTPYTHQYMQNIRAPYYEAEKLYKTYNSAGVLGRSFVFRIPVFKDMSYDGPSDNPTDNPSSDYMTNTAPATITFKNGQGSIDVAKIYETGSAIKPDVVVYDGDKLLVEGADYTVSFKNNKSASSDSKRAMVTVKGKGNYNSSMSFGFDILKNGSSSYKDAIDMKTCQVSGVSNLSYDPSARVQYYTQSDYFVKDAEGTYLTEGKDYIVNYSENTGAGTASMVIKGCGRYKGVLVKKFKISPYVLGGTDVTVVADNTAIYEKGGVELPLVVKLLGKTLVEGRDYKLSYENNKAAGQATYIVKGKNNYSGGVFGSFEITKKDFSKVTILTSNAVASTKPGKWRPKVVIVDTNGKELKERLDYSSDFKFTYVNTTKVQELVAIKTYAEATRYAGQEVQPNDIIPSGTMLRLTITGQGSYTNDSCSTIFTVDRKDMAKAKIYSQSPSYTGEAVILDPSDISVNLLGEFLVYRKDYEVMNLTYGSNLDAGKATVYMRGIGSFGGYKKVTFKVMPKGIHQ